MVAQDESYVKIGFLVWNGWLEMADTGTDVARKTAWKPLRWWEWLLLILCLCLFAAQSFASSLQKSAAFDEQYHLAAGYAYLKTGDFRLSRSVGHPPLVNVLSALPLLTIQDIEMPLEHPAWERGDFQWFSDILLWQMNDDPQQMLALARLPIVILGALTALVLFTWARQMAGPVAGWLAIILAVFEPNLLANSRLVTTDLGLTFFILLLMWRLWVWLNRPSVPNLLFVGISAGLAMATKYTGLLIWPIILIILLIYPDFNIRRILKMLLMALIAFGVLWAVYLFDVGPVEELGISIPVVAPAYPAAVWNTFTYINEQPVPAYLLGEISSDGWWYYFPLSLAFKTPLPLLVLAGVGLLTVIHMLGVRRTSILWLPPLTYMLLAMAGNFNIGYRHILQLVPFLILMASFTVLLPSIFFDRVKLLDKEAISNPKIPLILIGAILILLLLWQVVGTIRLYPHFESYFNELAGGPDKGNMLLVDSNLDWGQDLPALKQLMDEMGIEEVNLSYFGTAAPEAYSVKYKPIPGFIRFTSGPEVDAYNPYSPNPGWYAIGATSLRLGLVRQNPDIYEFFQERVPDARAGYSINLYNVAYPQSMPVQRIPVSGQSVSDIPEEQLNLQPGHRSIVKWSESSETTIISPEDWRKPLAIRELHADFNDVFSLIGFEIKQTEVSPGDQVELTLYWRKGTDDVDTPSPASGPPLATFVHLIAEESGQILAQYDGWGAALSGLETGDVVRQEVSLRIPEDAENGTFSLLTGLYSPQSSSRLAVTTNGQVGDYLNPTDIVILDNAGG